MRVGTIVVNYRKNALRIELPDQFMIHPIFYVIHITPVVKNPEHIVKDKHERLDPITRVEE